MKICITILLFITTFNCFSQQYFNYLDHTIDSPPDFFSRQFAEPENDVFREVLAYDTSINSRPYRIRTYSLMAPRFKPGIYITCVYSPNDNRWVCEHARAFPVRKSHANQVITLGNNTYDSLLFLAASDWTNPGNPIIDSNNFLTTKGLTFMVGKPPWLITRSKDQTTVYYSKLDSGSLSQIKNSDSKAAEEIDNLVDNISEQRIAYYDYLFNNKSFKQTSQDVGENDNLNSRPINSEDIYGN